MHASSLWTRLCCDWHHMYSHRHKHSLLIRCHKLFENLMFLIRYEIFNVQFNTLDTFNHVRYINCFSYGQKVIIFNSFSRYSFQVFICKNWSCSCRICNRRFYRELLKSRYGRFISTEYQNIFNYNNIGSFEKCIFQLFKVAREYARASTNSA